MTRMEGTLMEAGKLYLADAYRATAPGLVAAHGADGSVVLDQSLFYATSGGQPGDRGMLAWEGGTLPIGTAIKGDGDTIVLIPEEQGPLPPIGTPVTQEIDMTLRRGHMRVHTALHLLSVVIPRPVTGGSISADKGRLDFDMDVAPEKAAVEAALNELIARDLPVSDRWITDAEMDAQPELVKTLSVAPPRGSGRVRLVQIGAGADPVDLQPCGGTHVARTGEIGRIRVGKMEKKGRQNRRVYIHLDDTP
ncbi:MAG: alanyl-tRNA editing protein [Pseudomonadota bacterium]